MLNERSDVYSFGVLVMEMITGRTPVDYTRPTAEVSCPRRRFLSFFYPHFDRHARHYQYTLLWWS